MSVVQFWIKWAEAAGKMPLRASILASVALLLAAALMDWVTGPELASAIFYLVPIMWGTWKAGRWAGLGTALVSGVIWLVLLLISHKPYANPVIPFWNASVCTISFCLVSGLLSEALERKRLEGRVRQARADLAKQAGILQSILDSMGTRHIAEELRLGIKTVESYRARIREKLQLNDGEQLLQCAIQWAQRSESRASGMADKASCNGTAAFTSEAGGNGGSCAVTRKANLCLDEQVPCNEGVHG